MATTRSNTIIVKGDPVQKEGTAGAALSPGHLVMIATSSAGGPLITYSKHATAKAAAARNYVRERDWIGRDTSEVIPTGDRIEIVCARPGDEVYARIATGVEIATPGVMLESAGDGTLRPVTAASEGVLAGIPIAVSMEAVDNTDGDVPFVRIEVL
jgi:hypothetical protein